MGEVRNSWGWGVPSYTPATRQQYDADDDDDDSSAPVYVPPSPSAAARVAQSPSLMARRHSMSAVHFPSSGSSTPKQRSLSQHPQQQQQQQQQQQRPLLSPNFMDKVSKVQDRICSAREECIELRQEASDLQEYSNAKIERVTRYLGVLAEKARRLDEVSLDSESRVFPLKKEKKKLFNELVSVKGNIRVYGRARPQFEDEGPPSTSYPDDFTIRLNSAQNKDFELDRIYGPHLSQGELFQDLQPLVQSALDGYNVSIFAYGQTGSGKTYTMEGPSHDRGLYYRAFEELFDLVNAEATPTSSTAFYVTMFELYNEQVRDLLRAPDSRGGSTVMFGDGVELVDERIDSPSGFARLFKFGSQMRANVDGVKTDRSSRSHLVVTIHIHSSDALTGDEQYSKLSMVDLAGSERLSKADAVGDRLTESLHINKSLSALGDVFSALSAKKDYVPYDHSKLTQLLADSLGGESKAVLIVNVSPSNVDVQETIASLNFASRARNAEISLGNRDTIKKWRDMVSEARRELYEKEKEATEAQGEVMQLKREVKEADDQCLLLFGEVQKAWKLASSLQNDLTTHESYIDKLQAENERLNDQLSREYDQHASVKSQLAQFTTREEQYQAQLQERGARTEALEVRVQVLEQQLNEARVAAARTLPARQDNSAELQRVREEMENALDMSQKLEEELTKRDELIERLHQENEKLFERLTERTVAAASSPRVVGTPKIPRAESRAMEDFNLDSGFPSTAVPASPDMRSSSSMRQSSAGPLPGSPRGAILKYGSGEQVKTTPAGEYLTAALIDFNPDQYETDAAVADGANKLLMLVLAAVIKAGASREHEMLAEIQGAVFAFIRRMETRPAMDTMLVSRVRILYIRSLLSRAPELQSLKVPPVERFLEKAGSGSGSGRGSRNSSLGSSPQRSPRSRDGDDFGHGFRVNLRQEKRSKFSSLFSKLMGGDQDSGRPYVTGGKLKETTDEARVFAIGNKALASLFVHTPAGELQRQIRGWLAENFDFLSLSGGETIDGVTSHLELLSTAILDGWMSGLGIPALPSTDALGQLLSEYTKMVYTRQLQHLKDVAATLATEEAEDAGQVTKLRSALEAVEHKRRKVLMQMRSNAALLSKDDGGASPTRNPSMDTENARVASLIALEDILKQAEEIRKDCPQRGTTAAKKMNYLRRLDALEERLTSVLSIDHPSAHKCIVNTRNFVELLEIHPESARHARSQSRALDDFDTASDTDDAPAAALDGSGSSSSEVIQWSVLQFNNGSATPFVIKCGATSSLELVVKAQAKLQDRAGKEIVAVVPTPSLLTGLSLEDIRETISHLPEAFCQLAMARTAEGTRARYERLYKTLAVRVPALKHVMEDLEEK